MTASIDPTLAPAAPAPAPTHSEFELTLDLEHGYAQAVTFDHPSSVAMTIDEPPPVGEGVGPNPARMLAAAVGSCLTASLAFCLRKARVDLGGVHTSVRGAIVRAERGRLRIGHLDVVLKPVIAGADHERIARCLDVFEDYCIVTATVRRSIPIDVRVVPRFTSEPLHSSTGDGTHG